jgi:hypothetical protein
MVLDQIVELGSWMIVAKLLSQEYADSHRLVVVLVETIVNVMLFLLPATAVWFPTRKRWPKTSSVATCLWCSIYVLCLFFLFPATDGP